MLDHIERVLHPECVPTRKETPTFSEWSVAGSGRSGWSVA
jgi:hypothetical protein